MNKREINEKNKAIWNQNANVWDAKMGGKGNRWHLELVAPYTEDLLALKKEDHVLDIGCGNGIFARRIAHKNYKVTAFDFSSENIENAIKHGGDIKYVVADATVLSDLEALGNSFDKAVANMVFMDMPMLDVLFSYLFKVLKDDGCFVFSIQHPAFNSEFVDVKGSSLIINDYHKISTSKGVALDEQPEEQYYFHRPISEYSKLAMKHGFVIELIEEPVFVEDEIFSKIPPIMIFKLIKI